MGSLSVVRAAEAGYCRSHPDYFIETYCHIEDKDAEEIVQPFELWDAQREALASITAHRLNIILKARQLGITWLCISIAGHELLFFPGHTVIALSRTEDEAKELVRRLWSVELGNMPELIAPADKLPPGWGGPVFSHTALSATITFPDGTESVFKAFASGAGAGRSFTANLLLLDEWAFQAFATEIWLATYPTVNRPTGGRVIGLSTIERGTLFEAIYTEDNNFNKIFIPWCADPRRTPEWYAQTKRDLGDLVMQEYPATVEEALTIPGGSFFPEVMGGRHLCERQEMDGWRRYCCIDYGLDMFSAHWVAVDSENRAVVYREYDAPDTTIGEAGRLLRELSAGEKIELYLAPPDLWNRSQESGKSRFSLFLEAGITLTKTNNDLAAGCASLKEWLALNDGGEPALRIERDAAPNLLRCLTKIQKDKARPNIYAKEPHPLTHDIDSLRCFAIYWTSPAARPQAARVEWRRDQWEDYRGADADGKKYLIEKWGNPGGGQLIINN